VSGYDQVKELSKELGTPIPQLLALARNNDPYFAGAPAQTNKANWFGQLWRRYGFGSGVHLRRVHYQLVSTGATLPDGKPYQNTIECWGLLCDAGKAARYLGLVNPTAFEDRRNPPPTNNLYQPYYEKEPTATIDEPEWAMPKIEIDLGFNLDVPAPTIGGYEYEPVDQPYYMALYVEKSTMNDVLGPICQELGIDYFTSLGFQSITTVVNMLQRIERFEKPARILYISDFDPAGDFMPVGVARQIEYWRERYCSQEVKLQPIALTRDQVQQWRLPPIPIKESDLRANGFMDRWGVDGATELDALEALHPGELANIVRSAAAPYRDEALPRRLSRARRDAASVADSEWKEATADLSAELDTLRDDTQTVIDQYQDELNDLSERFNSDLAPLAERMQALLSRLEELRSDYRPELPERPEPETDGDDDIETLLDTNRDYMEQLRVYKLRKAGEDLN
jgi:hypothetical protein